jgi:hypothetical protein
MATLIRLSDSTSIPLTPVALAGRSATCWLRLEERFASSGHAQLWFDGEAWLLKDLGSKNGTYVDGSQLEMGRPIRLWSGARIGFGEVTPAYEVGDVGPPVPLALDLATSGIITGGSLLALPNDRRPDAVVYRGVSGWLIESSSGEVRAIEDLELVHAGERLFRVYLPQAIAPTPEVDLEFTLRNASFRFDVDPERVSIEVLFRGREIARLESVEYGSLLWTLARARLDDRTRPIDERGWRSVEELCELQSVAPTELNSAIYRARKRIAATKLVGALGIVEVKRGMRRFGSDRIELVDRMSKCCA